MKKALSFLRSMRFGMILLAAIALLSVLGTIIPQDQSAAAYEELYPKAAGFIRFFGLDRLYSMWYYVGLYALLGLSLLACSVTRFGRVKRAKDALLTRVRVATPQDGISSENAKTLLRRHGFHPAGDAWMRHEPGLYGSFVTHLAMLVMLIACALVFALEVKTDYSIPVGQAAVLPDGTMIHVDAFSMERDGKLDYVSELTAVLPDRTRQQGTIRVNQPKRFGAYKVYQQSYAYMGEVDVRTGENEPDERVDLDSAAFLTLDGTNGVSYMGVFGTYQRMADGRILPSGYSDEEGEPVEAYMVALLEGGQQEVRLVAVDEPVEVAGVYYTFRSPAAYPGIRVKTVPGFVMPLLYTSFALLLVGLYLCFFCVPAAAQIRADGVALASGKDITDLIDTLREESASRSE